MSPTDKIKRNFVWLRKALEIIQKTTLPGTINNEVRVGIDLFGWERLVENNTLQASGGTGAVQVNGLLAPEGSLRLVLAADVHHNDVVARTVWIDKATQAGGVAVGILSPLLVGDLQRHALDHWTFLAPGERLSAKADAMGVAAILSLTLSVIDLPIGEYIRPLR